MSDRAQPLGNSELLPPSRPSRRIETVANRLFLALSPRLGCQEQSPAPPHLGPYCDFQIARRGRGGGLAARLFPASAPRGAVLLVHPWRPWGKAYFHTRGRIQALRQAGYHVLSFDLSGFGSSSPVRGFFDRDIADGLLWLRDYAGDLPLHLWGVSAGGYWAHAALSRSPLAVGAMFEDVPPHLLEWSHRMAPRGWPFYKLFEHAFGSAYRYLDARSHAPFLGLEAVAYVSGGEDRGVRPEDTRQLAKLAGGSSTIIDGAEHLGSIRRAGRQVVALALDIFTRAEVAATSGESVVESRASRLSTARSGEVEFSDPEPWLAADCSMVVGAAG